jgi:hypothetical protein
LEPPDKRNAKTVFYLIEKINHGNFSFLEKKRGAFVQATLFTDHHFSSAPLLFAIQETKKTEAKNTA